MLIRAEIPVDAPGIDALLRRAFQRDAEADLVQRLREDGLLTLGIVATDPEGGVIGYAAFSPVWIEGEDCQWVGLAPLAVEDEFRHQGIARQLVYEALDMLNEFGYRGVVVQGDPAYYAALGFVPAAHGHLHCQQFAAAAPLHIFTLAEDAMADANGRVEYAEPFNQLLN
ncbi:MULTISPECIES: GNAT family N-acetyltransferase [Sodalis]|uniref:Putative acetyltransferase n=1 Tax=Sodalis ligni TaxID=2697027 RepID=A0A4R1NHA3_9GAMM|nr:N-acetyltransferase [Sodalis ligni]TCL06427.1 putative acetyltransferase [Sodalis ligni]